MTAISALSQFQVVESCEWTIDAQDAAEAEEIMVDGVDFGNELCKAILGFEVEERDSEPADEPGKFIITERTRFLITAPTAGSAYCLVRDGVGPTDELAKRGYAVEVTERYVVGFDVTDDNCEDEIPSPALSA